MVSYVSFVSVRLSVSVVIVVVTVSTVVVMGVNEMKRTKVWGLILTLKKGGFL